MQFDAKNKRDNAPLEKVTLSHFNKLGSTDSVIRKMNDVLQMIFLCVFFQDFLLIDNRIALAL